MIDLLPWQQIILESAADTRQSQIEKSRFETETFVLNWDFDNLIIPSKCLESLLRN